MSICLWYILGLTVIAVSSRVAVIASSTDRNVSHVAMVPHKMKRSSTPPNIQCNNSNEELIKIDSILKYTIWICRSGEWIPYEIKPSLGKVKSVAANSCEHIREVLATNCNNLPDSGLYWVWKEKPMQVYCEMQTDGGGWTLVWTHSYMEVSPLSTNMYYYSDYYKSCTTHDSGWCNVPNKKRFNPTEQMIVAYHKGTIVYAYKGIFNYNIDHDWTGGVLVNFKKIMDTCTNSGSPNVQPAPSAHGGDTALLGLAFDKRSPYNNVINCDTIHGSFHSPSECRWHDCTLDKNLRNTQMTMAIYVR